MHNLTRFSTLLARAHPGTRMEHRLQRLVGRTVVHALRHSSYVTDWYPSLDDPLMLRILEAHPRICEKVARPYLCCGLSYAERHRALIGQYRWLRARLSEQALTAIFLGEGLELARLLPGGTGEHRLILHYLDQFEMEGDLTLSLVRVGGPRIFSLTFSILEGERGMHVQIGGAQGGAGDIGEVVRQLTKAWQGMRPKALVLCALMELASAWGTVHLSGVGDAHHVYRCLSFHRGRKAHIHADYDSLWRDAGGCVDAADPRLYTLPLAWPIRALETVSAHKRPMYRRRYAMLNMLQAEIDARAQEALRHDGVSLAPRRLAGSAVVPVHLVEAGLGHQHGVGDTQIL